MKDLDRDSKMIADIRVLHAEVLALCNGLAALRTRYTDHDLLKFAEIDVIREDAEKLKVVYSWLKVMEDALSDRKPKGAKRTMPKAAN